MSRWIPNKYQTVRWTRKRNLHPPVKYGTIARFSLLRYQNLHWEHDLDYHPALVLLSARPWRPTDSAILEQVL